MGAPPEYVLVRKAPDEEADGRSWQAFRGRSDARRVRYIEGVRRPAQSHVPPQSQLPVQEGARTGSAGEEDGERAPAHRRPQARPAWRGRAKRAHDPRVP